MAYRAYQPGFIPAQRADTTVFSTLGTGSKLYLVLEGRPRAFFLVVIARFHERLSMARQRAQDIRVFGLLPFACILDPVKRIYR